MNSTYFLCFQAPTIAKDKTNSDMNNDLMKTATEDMMDDAVDKLINTTSKIPPEDAFYIVKTLPTLLNSGQTSVVGKAEVIIKKLKEKKSVDWKFHIEEVESILVVIGGITKEQLHPDEVSGYNKSISSYLQFTRVFLEQLRKSKVLPKLQESLLKFVFSCMTVSTPLKTKIATVASEEKYLDFSKYKPNRLKVLQTCETMFKNKKLPLTEKYFGKAFNNVLIAVIKSYDENGKVVTTEENSLFISVFKSCGEVNSLDHFYIESDEDDVDDNVGGGYADDHTLSIYGKVYETSLLEYIQLHQATSTLGCIAQIFPDVLRWAKLAVAEDREEMTDILFSILSWVGQATPPNLKDNLTEILNLMLFSEYATYMHSLVEQLYPHNPDAVHAKLPDMFDKIGDLKDAERQIYIAYIFYMVAESHAEVFTPSMISKFLDLYPKITEAEKPMILLILRAIAEKNPSVLIKFLPKICDDDIFKPESMNVRSTIVSAIGGESKTLGQRAIDYLMKFVGHSDPTVSHVCIGYVSTLARDHIDYMQKYRSTLEKVEKNSKIPMARELAHYMILKLEGKTVENLVENVQEQQIDISELDEKVDGTMGTVISIGEKVVEHDNELGDLEVGVQKVEEKMDDVEQDMSEAKIKVKSLDNKTMSNAPKWSNDLAKLMNTPAENDWRLLASRLGYSNDDIRGWATHDDPCLALLNEWYATHKTSEASLTVLTTLKEINRIDGVVIVENAMKKAEDVIENDEFEYPSPPPLFISYQWGMQNEVKLLKQHLTMAGYECWMDIGQMGGGDKLFAKIDKGIRGAKMVICCMTREYADSPNCKREINLAVNLNKPIIPLLMEKMDWPPRGSMGPILSEYLFIRFFQRYDEETPEKDHRYWPLLKFQELLKQLNLWAVPDKTMVHKDYANWWSHENQGDDSVVGKKQRNYQKQHKGESTLSKRDGSLLVFLSYQRDKEQQIKSLHQRFTSFGYTVWVATYEMGGGDILTNKTERAIRDCKVVISCATLEYIQSDTCQIEISLACTLKKPIIVMLMDHMKWPPDGPMHTVFKDIPYIEFHQDEAAPVAWQEEKFEEMIRKLNQIILDVAEQNNARRSKSNGDDFKDSYLEHKHTVNINSSDIKICNDKSGSETEPKSEQNKVKQHSSPKSSSCAIL